jgi:hypothetical protein
MLPVYSNSDDGGVAPSGQEAVCLDCADEQPCLFDRCRGKVRENASAAVTPADLGEFQELAPAAVSPVIHRTPEELGIPRTVPDVPVRRERSVRPDWNEGPCPSPMREAHVKRDRLNRERAIVTSRGAKATMPRTVNALAVMAGAAMEELKKEKVKVSKTSYDMTSELNQKIAAEVATRPTAEIAASLNVPLSRVYHIRSQLRRMGKLKERGKRRPGRASKLAVGVRRVEIDPKRNGSAAALIHAFEKIDAGGAAEKISIELSGEEAARVVARMSPLQREAFLSAGLRAALLASFA